MSTRETVRNISALCLALPLACAALAAQDADSEIQRHFLAAKQAQGAGRLDIAAQEYAAVIRLAPGIAEVHANLGLIYHAQAKYDLSAQALDKALALKPDLRGTSLFLGIDYVKLNQPRLAVPRLKRAVEQEPGNKEAHTWLATALWDAGQEDAAVNELRGAAKSFPSDPDILFLLGHAYRNRANRELGKAMSPIGTPLYHQAFGDIYLDQQQWEKAAGHYRRAAAKDPRRAGPHLGLANVLFRQGKWDEAKREYDMELAVDPGSAAATAMLAHLAILNGDAGQALRLLGGAIPISPEQSAHALGLPPLPFSAAAEPVSEEVRARYRQALSGLEKAPAGAARSLALATVYLRLGRGGESQSEFQSFRAAAPPFSRLKSPYDRARAAFHLHDFAAAESLLVPLTAGSPGNQEARYLLARTFEHLSLAVLGSLLSSHPDSARAHQLLAETYEHQEDNQKALAEYRVVERMDDGLSGLHFAIGHLLWKLDQPDQAIPELQQELRLNPAHAEANAEIGSILVTRREQDKGIPYLQKALQLKPGLSTARQELGKAFYQKKDFARAAQELKQSISSDPEGNAHFLLGMAYQRLGCIDESRAALAESRRIKAERLAGQAIAPVPEPAP